MDNQRFDALKVLIVDDNLHMRQIIAAVLKGIGIRSIEDACDGSSALRLLREWSPDVAIVDCQMSPMDGMAFTEVVRRDAESRNPYLPIIMVTAHSDLQRVIGAREAGVTELIVKPLTAEALISRLDSVIYRPRPFAKTDTYFGPSRRRRKNCAYEGPERRARRDATLIE